MSNKKHFNDNEKAKDNQKQKQKKRTRPKLKLPNKLSNEIVNERYVIQHDETRLMPSLESEFQLERSSTPDIEGMCEHCKHSHLQECCMYVYDNYEDIVRYSTFKHGVDEPYSVKNYDENLGMKISGKTPSYFPGFTERIPAIADLRMLANNNSQLQHAQPIVYLRQFFWPIFLPTTFHAPTTQVYNANQNIHDPNNLNFYQPPVMYSKITQSQQCLIRSQPSPNIPIPILQRQIPMHYGNSSPYINYKNHQPHFAQIHNYVPINYNYNHTHNHNNFNGHQ
ncbi:hypothetical protein PVAND_014250 [Polypedilum vanderplanki]|uniref:Uncharacterized protein n=1 Tax=Polypedilum vanderplanki TaxID=319348 RepID=A0A9J6CSV1_POLVA|nr:hypothetical protein PVAND_014250 [Polypedilum vanderplanki]